MKIHRIFGTEEKENTNFSKANQTLNEIAFGKAPPIQHPYLPDVEISDFLQGLILVDLINFSWLSETIEEEIAVLTYYQIGLGDIFHILAAKHLGCEYFVSWDSDFKGDILEKIIKDNFNLKLIKSQESLEALLKKLIM